MRAKGRVLMGVLIGLCVINTTLAQSQYAFQVNFTNKTGSPGVTGLPITYLSQRALDRRTQQGIAVDSTDWPVSPPYIDSVLVLTGGKFHETSRWLNFMVVLVNDPADVIPLQDKPYISSVNQVASYSTPLHRSGADTQHPAGHETGAKYLPLYKTTGSAAYYGTTYTQTAIVHGDFLHDQGYKGQGKMIAVLDAGFNATDTHPGFDSLRQSGRIVDVHNFTYDTDYVYSYDIHGTESLSTMAGNTPGTFVGSAPLASYALYVTEDDGSEQPIELDNLIAGAERADSVGADIISISLGYNTFDNAAYNFNFATDFDGKTTVAAKAANFAARKGMLFVASAGNEGGDSWNMVLTPGDADSALTVGSVDISGTPASNSGYGPNAAGQIKPDVCTMGQPAAVFSNSGYSSGNGTSFSTPQMAGWAACLWQADGNATPGKIHAVINESANYYTNPNSHIGYGIPDFQRACYLLKINDTLLPGTLPWVAAVPNPFSNVINLSVRADDSQTVSFTLLDVSGKQVASFAKRFNKGSNAAVAWAVPDVPAGVYFLRAVGGTRRQVIKLEKQ